MSRQASRLRTGARRQRLDEARARLRCGDFPGALALCRKRLERRLPSPASISVVLEERDLPSAACEHFASSDAVPDYRRTARERYTSTPSAEQVVRPLYRSSIGRFRHYARWLTPEIETLTPWMERFGYEP